MKYKCEKCSKEVGQVIWNKETKKWECKDCYYEEDDNRQKSKNVL